MKKIIITNGKKVILRVTVSGDEEQIVNDFYSEVTEKLFVWHRMRTILNQKEEK